MRKGPSLFNVVSVALGLAFLYLPITILVIYSFNASRLVTVWGGWSIRWYVALLHDSAMLEAAWNSLRIAAVSATAATVLGTLAAVALVRAGRFRGRTAFSAMVYAPLVMPEVITGLSLLAAVCRDQHRPRFLDGCDRAHHGDHELRHGGGAVAADQLRPESGGGGDGPRLPAAEDLHGHNPAADLPGGGGGLDARLHAVVRRPGDRKLHHGPGATTLPMRIYSEVRLGVKPEINAICTIMIAVVAIGVVAAALVSKRSELRKAQAAAMPG